MAHRHNAEIHQENLSFRGPPSRKDWNIDPRLHVHKTRRMGARLPSKHIATIVAMNQGFVLARSGPLQESRGDVRDVLLN